MAAPQQHTLTNAPVSLAASPTVLSSVASSHQGHGDLYAKLSDPLAPDVHRVVIPQPNSNHPLPRPASRRPRPCSLCGTSAVRSLSTAVATAPLDPSEQPVVLLHRLEDGLPQVDVNSLRAYGTIRLLPVHRGTPAGHNYGSDHGGDADNRELSHAMAHAALDADRRKLEIKSRLEFTKLGVGRSRGEISPLSEVNHENSASNINQTVQVVGTDSFCETVINSVEIKSGSVIKDCSASGAAVTGAYEIKGDSWQKGDDSVRGIESVGRGGGTVTSSPLPPTPASPPHSPGLPCKASPPSSARQPLLPILAEDSHITPPSPTHTPSSQYSSHPSSCTDSISTTHSSVKHRVITTQSSPLSPDHFQQPSAPSSPYTPMSVLLPFLSSSPVAFPSCSPDSSHPLSPPSPSTISPPGSPPSPPSPPLSLHSPKYLETLSSSSHLNMPPSSPYSPRTLPSTPNSPASLPSRSSSPPSPSPSLGSTPPSPAILHPQLHLSLELNHEPLNSATSVHGATPTKREVNPTEDGDTQVQQSPSTEVTSLSQPMKDELETNSLSETEDNNKALHLHPLGHTQVQAADNANLAGLEDEVGAPGNLSEANAACVEETERLAPEVDGVIGALPPKCTESSDNEVERDQSDNRNSLMKLVLKVKHPGVQSPSETEKKDCNKENGIPKIVLTRKGNGPNREYSCSNRLRNEDQNLSGEAVNKKHKSKKNKKEKAKSKKMKKVMKTDKHKRHLELFGEDSNDSCDISRDQCNGLLGKKEQHTQSPSSSQQDHPVPLAFPTLGESPENSGSELPPTPTEKEQYSFSVKVESVCHKLKHSSISDSIDDSFSDSLPDLESPPHPDHDKSIECTVSQSPVVAQELKQDCRENVELENENQEPQHVSLAPTNDRPKDLAPDNASPDKEKVIDDSPRFKSGKNSPSMKQREKSDCHEISDKQCQSAPRCRRDRHVKKTESGRNSDACLWVSFGMNAPVPLPASDMPGLAPIMTAESRTSARRDKDDSENDKFSLDENEELPNLVKPKREKKRHSSATKNNSQENRPEVKFEDKSSRDDEVIDTKIDLPSAEFTKEKEASFRRSKSHSRRRRVVRSRTTRRSRTHPLFSYRRSRISPEELQNTSRRTRSSSADLKRKAEKETPDSSPHEPSGKINNDSTSLNSELDQDSCPDQQKDVHKDFVTDQNVQNKDVNSNSEKTFRESSPSSDGNERHSSSQDIIANQIPAVTTDLKLKEGQSTNQNQNTTEDENTREEQITRLDCNERQDHNGKQDRITKEDENAMNDQNVRQDSMTGEDQNAMHDRRTSPDQSVRQDHNQSLSGNQGVEIIHGQKTSQNQNRKQSKGTNKAIVTCKNPNSSKSINPKPEENTNQDVSTDEASISQEANVTQDLNVGKDSSFQDIHSQNANVVSNTGAVQDVTTCDSEVNDSQVKNGYDKTDCDIKNSEAADLSLKENEHTGDAQPDELPIPQLHSSAVSQNLNEHLHIEEAGEPQYYRPKKIRKVDHSKTLSQSATSSNITQQPELKILPVGILTETTKSQSPSENDKDSSITPPQNTNETTNSSETPGTHVRLDESNSECEAPQKRLQSEGAVDILPECTRQSVSPADDSQAAEKQQKKRKSNARGSRKQLSRGVGSKEESQDTSSAQMEERKAEEASYVLDTAPKDDTTKKEGTKEQEKKKKQRRIKKKDMSGGGGGGKGSALQDALHLQEVAHEEERRKRLAREIKGFNWLEQKIKNGSLHPVSGSSPSTSSSSSSSTPTTPKESAKSLSSLLPEPAVPAQASSLSFQAKKNDEGVARRNSVSSSSSGLRGHLQIAVPPLAPFSRVTALPKLRPTNSTPTTPVPVTATPATPTSAISTPFTPTSAKSTSGTPTPAPPTPAVSTPATPTPVTPTLAVVYSASSAHNMTVHSPLFSTTQTYHSSALGKVTGPFLTKPDVFGYQLSDSNKATLYSSTSHSKATLYGVQDDSLELFYDTVKASTNCYGSASRNDTSNPSINSTSSLSNLCGSSKKLETITQPSVVFSSSSHIGSSTATATTAALLHPQPQHPGVASQQQQNISSVSLHTGSTSENKCFSHKHTLLRRAFRELLKSESESSPEPPQNEKTMEPFISTFDASTKDDDDDGSQMKEMKIRSTCPVASDSPDGSNTSGTTDHSSTTGAKHPLPQVTVAPSSTTPTAPKPAASGVEEGHKSNSPDGARQSAVQERRPSFTVKEENKISFQAMVKTELPDCEIPEVESDSTSVKVSPQDSVESDNKDRESHATWNTKTTINENEVNIVQDLPNSIQNKVIKSLPEEADLDVEYLKRETKLDTARGKDDSEMQSSFVLYKELYKELMKTRQELEKLRKVQELMLTGQGDKKENNEDDSKKINDKTDDMMDTGSSDEQKCEKRRHADVFPNNEQGAVDPECTSLSEAKKSKITIRSDLLLASDASSSATCQDISASMESKLQEQDDRARLTKVPHASPLLSGPNVDISVVALDVSKQQVGQVESGTNHVQPKICSSMPLSSPGLPRASPGVVTNSPGLTRASPGAVVNSPGITRASPGVTRVSPGIPGSSPGIVRISPGIPRSSPVIPHSSPGVPRISPGLPQNSPVTPPASVTVPHASTVLSQTSVEVPHCASVMSHTSQFTGTTSTGQEPVTNPIASRPMAPPNATVVPLLPLCSPTGSRISPSVSRTSPIISRTNSVPSATLSKSDSTLSGLSPTKLRSVFGISNSEVELMPVSIGSKQPLPEPHPQTFLRVVEEHQQDNPILLNAVKGLRGHTSSKETEATATHIPSSFRRPSEDPRRGLHTQPYEGEIRRTAFSTSDLPDFPPSSRKQPPPLKPAASLVRRHSDTHDIRSVNPAMHRLIYPSSTHTNPVNSLHASSTATDSHNTVVVSSYSQPQTSTAHFTQPTQSGCRNTDTSNSERSREYQQAVAMGMQHQFPQHLAPRPAMMRSLGPDKATIFPIPPPIAPVVRQYKPATVPTTMPSMLDQYQNENLFRSSMPFFEKLRENIKQAHDSNLSAPDRGHPSHERAQPSTSSIEKPIQPQTFAPRVLVRESIPEVLQHVPPSTFAAPHFSAPGQHFTGIMASHHGHYPNSLHSGTTIHHLPQVGLHPGNHQTAQSVRTNSTATRRSSEGSRSEKKQCLNCPQQARFLCSGCKKAWYCSEQCQRDHWAAHNAACVL